MINIHILICLKYAYKCMNISLLKHHVNSWRWHNNHVHALNGKYLLDIAHTSHRLMLNAFKHKAQTLDTSRVGCLTSVIHSLCCWNTIWWNVFIFRKPYFFLFPVCTIPTNNTLVLCPALNAFHNSLSYPKRSSHASASKNAQQASSLAGGCHWQ